MSDTLFCTVYLALKFRLGGGVLRKRIMKHKGRTDVSISFVKWGGDGSNMMKHRVMTCSSCISVYRQGPGKNLTTRLQKEIDIELI